MPLLNELPISIFDALQASLFYLKQNTLLYTYNNVTFNDLFIFVYICKVKWIWFWYLDY